MKKINEQSRYSNEAELVYSTRKTSIWETLTVFLSGTFNCVLLCFFKTNKFLNYAMALSFPLLETSEPQKQKNKY